MAYRSSATATTNAGGNLSATPAGVQVGDYLSGWYCQDGSPPTFTVTSPSGWSEQKDLDENSLPDGAYMRYADKIAAGSDNFTFTTNDTAHDAVLIIAAHNGRAQTSSTSFITSSSLTTAAATPISASLTGGTAAAGDDLLIYIVVDNSTNASVWTFSVATGPGQCSQRQSLGAGSWVSMSLCTLDNFIGGATGAIAETLTGTGSSGWYAVVIAVKAAPPVGIPVRGFKA